MQKNILYLFFFSQFNEQECKEIVWHYNATYVYLSIRLTKQTRKTAKQITKTVSVKTEEIECQPDPRRAQRVARRDQPAHAHPPTDRPNARQETLALFLYLAGCIRKT